MNFSVSDDSTQASAKTQERLGWAISDCYFASPRAPLFQHQTSSFDDFAREGLAKVFQQYNPVSIFNDYSEEHNDYAVEILVTFSDIRFAPPTIAENNGVRTPMTPMDARLRGLTYASKGYGDVHFEVRQRSGPNLENVEVQHVRFSQVELLSVPVMVGSSLCGLSQAQSVQQRRALGESASETGGYFIVRGTEKAVICQERQAENSMSCFRAAKTRRATFCTEVKSTCVRRLLPAKKLQVKLAASVHGSDVHDVLASAPHFKHDVPVCVLFRALGIETDLAIACAVFPTLPLGPARSEEWEFCHLLRATLQACPEVRTRADALQYLTRATSVMGNPRELQLTDARRIQYVEDSLRTDILPHMGDDDARKGYYLGRMVRRLLMFSLDYVGEDDRDSYVNKRVETTGVLLGNLSRQYIKRMIKELRTALVKEMRESNWQYTRSVEDLVNTRNINRLFRSKTTEDGLRYCLSSGNWGFKNYNTKAGVAQLLNRMSYSSCMSTLRRINTHIEKTSKLIAPRKLHCTNWGYICPAETPEGANIGGVKNMAMLCEISAQFDSLFLVQSLLGSSPLVQPFSAGAATAAAADGAVPIFVDGDIVGFTVQPGEIVALVRAGRRSGLYHAHTSIAFSPTEREVTIFTDAGRVIRPVLIVEDGEVIALRPHVAARIAAGVPWQALLSELGAVEYVDAHETASLMICSSVAEFLDMTPSERRGYSHCEIHPSLIMGAVATAIPFSDHNQSPRNTYQSAMEKQSVGIYVDNYQDRIDTTAQVLDYPSEPLVQTAASAYTPRRRTPYGTNVIVAIMCYTGFNQEDSVIINQSALERGLFGSTVYRTYRDVKKPVHAPGSNEAFMKPTPADTRGMKFGSYDALDPRTGFARVGATVAGGDVIIGKVVSISAAAKQSMDLVSAAAARAGNSAAFGSSSGAAESGAAPSARAAKRYRDMSTTLRNSEQGVVHRVFESFNADSHHFVKVQMRAHRSPVIGDKFSSRHGQKGTVGMVYAQEDMPFTEDGLVPDIIMNPHAIPSRMTIGQVIECVMGTACSALGATGDGTPFTRLAVPDLCALLQQQGLDPHGEHTMYNGFTGQQLPCKIFAGPTFYQRLKHMVEDKVHARATGPSVLLTRQPTEGRARDGGLRMGEMERDCMIAHGASCFLQEKMHELSDGFNLAISRASGLPAAVNTAKNVFKTFDKADPTYDTVSIPYCTKLLGQELQSMGIAMRIVTEAKQQADDHHTKGRK